MLHQAAKLTMIDFDRIAPASIFNIKAVSGHRQKRRQGRQRSSHIFSSRYHHRQAKESYAMTISMTNNGNLQPTEADLEVDEADCRRQRWLYCRFNDEETF